MEEMRSQQWMVMQSRDYQQQENSPWLEEQREKVDHPVEAKPWQDCQAGNGAIEEMQPMMEIPARAGRGGVGGLCEYPGFFLPLISH